MGKKSKIFYYSVLIVNIVFFILDLLPINFPFFRLSFSVSLLLIGVLLVIRSVNYKIDSSMFFGVALFGMGLINMAQYFGFAYFNLDLNQLWPYYFFALALASIATALYYKSKTQMKLFILFLGFGMISLLFVQKLIVLWAFITLLITWFVGYFVVNIVIFKKKGDKNG